MFVRKTLAGAVTAALAGSAIALSAGAATAAADADDPTFTPTSADLIGVGSDTSQHALHLFAGAWNADPRTQGVARIASFAATGGGQITLPGGAINRPNGSGAGKGLLYGSGNNADIDFARSSSANSTAETQAGLQAFPFAVDTLIMAVSNSTPSHAPRSLTTAQIVGIYKGDIKNWSEVGGTAGAIKPMIPQAGSGTRSFFTAQLKAMNGGADVTLGSNVVEVQEHDPAPIQGDADAIAPFSEGRAGLAGTALRVETGFSADRALYNVVRGTDVSNALIQAAFGSSGALCSTDARALIEQAGFKQLATPEHGGVCGAPTQSATSNFATNEQIASVTSLKADSTKGGKVTLKAAVSASTSPSGTVDFLEGDTTVARNVPLVGGVASTTISAAPGDHTYTAVFTPEQGSQVDPSQADADVFVLFSAKVSESFPAKVAKGKKAVGSVAVTSGGRPAKGKVKIMEGSKTLATGSLKGGAAKFSLKLSKGKHQLKAVYAGTGTVAGSSKSFTIKQK